MSGLHQAVVVAQATNVLTTPTDAAHDTGIVTSYKGTSSVRVGAVQVALGICAFSIGCACAGEGCSSKVFGYGIWCGIILIIAGAFGIVAGKAKKRPMIIGYLIMSVIGLLQSVGIGLFSIIVLVADEDYKCWTDSEGFTHCDPRASATAEALDGVFVAAMCISLILCIWSTVLASHICSAEPKTHPQTQHYPHNTPVSNARTNMHAPVGSAVVVMTPSPHQSPVLYRHAYPSYPQPAMLPTGGPNLSNTAYTNHSTEPYNHTSPNYPGSAMYPTRVPNFAGLAYTNPNFEPDDPDDLRSSRPSMV